jgi:GT2 family glycosyltransferase
LFKLKNKKIGCDFNQTNNGKVDYITGAALFLPRRIIKKFGLFDPSFFMYYEETDLQKKYHSRGFFSKIIETPKIIHLEGASNISYPTFNKILIQLTSKLTYFKKWNNNLIFKLYLVLFLIIRSPFLLFSRYTKKEKAQYLELLISFLK